MKRCGDSSWTMFDPSLVGSPLLPAYMHTSMTSINDGTFIFTSRYSWPIPFSENSALSSWQKYLIYMHSALIITVRYLNSFIATCVPVIAEWGTGRQFHLLSGSECSMLTHSLVRSRLFGVMASQRLTRRERKFGWDFSLLWKWPCLFVGRWGWSLKVLFRMYSPCYQNHLIVANHLSGSVEVPVYSLLYYSECFGFAVLLCPHPWLYFTITWIWTCMNLDS